MKDISLKSDHQIKLDGFQAIKNELGVETGEGNYVEDRKVWQKDYKNVRELAEQIIAERHSS